MVKGTVKSVTNNQIVMFKRTDELGRVQKVKTNFLYGDDNTLVAENKTVGANDGDKIYAHQSINEYLRVRGGSGSYKFELLDTFGGAFKLDEDEGSSASVYTSEGVKAGTYNVRVKAIDEDKPSLTAVATLTVVVSESYERPATDMVHTVMTGVKMESSIHQQNIFQREITWYILINTE